MEDQHPGSTDDRRSMRMTSLPREYSSATWGSLFANSLPPTHLAEQPHLTGLRAKLHCRTSNSSDTFAGQPTVHHGGMPLYQPPPTSQFRAPTPSPSVSAGVEFGSSPGLPASPPTAMPRQSNSGPNVPLSQNEVPCVPYSSTSAARVGTPAVDCTPAAASEDTPSMVTEGGGQDAGGGKAPAKSARKASQPWAPDEQIALVRLFGKDDALCACASGPHRCMKRQDQLEWISKCMKAEGYRRSAEDCRKKWASLLEKVKEINDKCGRSGGESYWDMAKEKRREAGVHPVFNKALWDAMEWNMKKPSMTCDNTLASDSMQSTNEDVRAGGSGDGEGSAGGVGR
ncbi:hypothetical protein CBR_g2793 [Chara braunii]|uniref:Myb-like domain-containing protein n=1 Tax=Chara braunii TaxID=69332 RepID=A0A388KDV3_CHABU|nr:hypothetical protein CBR_g2793 [Chara braunii]|eukprot:GBG68242.1 hypothetical protein CBR_g2793 [Chara braunii]